MLIFWSLVRNSVVLAVYLLFSVACFLTIHEHWCKDSRKTLFLRFPCTKSLVFFGAPTPRTWCKDSRKTLFLRFPCTKSLDLFGVPTPRTWCKGSRKTLFFRFSCTKSLALFGAPTLRTWCTNPRNPLFLRRGAPRPRPRMGLEKEVRTNLPFDCTSFHFCSV